MVSPTTPGVEAESQSRLLAALLGLGRGEAADAVAFSEIARQAAAMVPANGGAVLRLLGAQRAVIVGEWREGDTRGMPVNAELDFDRFNSALGRAQSTGLPARAESYEGRRGELPVVMGAVGVRSSVAAPIFLGETMWGAIAVSSTREEQFPPETEQRLEWLAELTGRALDAARGRQALARSRLRLVEGADEARRALERELHEGAHQLLLALLLKLRVARTRATDGSPVAGLLDEAIDGALEADASLRDLARGLFPVALSERGLAAAVQALVVRADVTVDLRRLPGGRYPPLAEATAYFAVADALAGAIEHAGAASVELSVWEEGDRLAVELRDDGAHPTGGLEIARERIAALGGTIAVDTRRGGGNVVRVALPIEPGQSLNSAP